jgi:hypothetical protein
VFVCNVAANAKKVLRGEVKNAIYRGLKTVEEVGASARERWLVARAERVPDYRDWTVAEFEKLFSLRSVGSPSIHLVDSTRKVAVVDAIR